MRRKTVILIGSEGLIGKNFKNFLKNKNLNILSVDIKNKNSDSKDKNTYLKKIGFTVKELQ